jgi:hypothetical protein
MCFALVTKKLNILKSNFESISHLSSDSKQEKILNSKGFKIRTEKG